VLKFRNITASPDDSVDRWGVEGLLIAIERGTAPDWSKVIKSTLASGPQSELRKDLDEALSLAEGGGKAAIELVLLREEESPEKRVQRRIRVAFLMADMTFTEFAAQVGTSRSRMSTYLSGKTMPLAHVLEKMEMIGRARRDMILFE
jgi:hypothetical protein